MSARYAAVTLLGLAAGCYNYFPLTTADPRPGTRVSAQPSDSATLAPPRRPGAAPPPPGRRPGRGGAGAATGGGVPAGGGRHYAGRGRARASPRVAPPAPAAGGPVPRQTAARMPRTRADGRDAGT